MKKKIEKFFKYVFVTNADHEIWIVSSVVLFLAMAVFAAYSFQPDFNRSVNSLLWGTQQKSQTQEKLFHLPVTVVYNSSSQDQKMKMDQFLQNLTDPQQALVNTDLQTTWLDSKDPKAQDLIARSGLKYLPQVFVDVSIEQHPQYQAMQQYLNKKDNFYFIRLAPLENLQIPPVEGGHVAGADPEKAKVVIQAYESYSCDHCATVQDAFKKILKEYPDTVSIVYKHFEPGDLYNQIAQGAECAADQNKFTEMQDQLYKGQPAMLQKFQTFTKTEEATSYARTALETYAKAIRLNMALFKTCLDGAVHQKSIEMQTLDAIDYGINGPPAFFINKNFQNGLLSYDEFKSIIEEELKK